MKQVFQVFDKGIEYLEVFVSTISLIIVTILVFLQVILRYAFSSSIQWTEEVVIMLIVYMAMFGAARAVRKNEHTEVAGLAKALPKAGGIALRVLTNTIVLITIFIMIYGSFFLASRITTVTPVLRFKMSYNYYGIAVGSALMLYEYLKLMKTRILGR